MRRFIGTATLLALTFWAGSVAAASERLTANVHDYTLERDVTLEAEVTIPSAASWPVAVILHGCDGVNQWSKPALERRARFYAGHGYATIILDSWKPRGLRQLCAPHDPKYLGLVDPATRVADIEEITAALASLPGFNGEMLVDGLSHGGWTALSLPGMEGEEPLKAKLTGVVAWYPPCAAIDPAINIPTLVIAAAEDRHPATPPQDCVAAGERYEWVDVLLLEAASHAFDYPNPPAVAGPGGRIIHNAGATDRAYERLADWLTEQHLP